MHPDIKAFWIAEGLTPMGGISPTFTWEVHIDLGMSIYRIEVVCHGNRHRYKNKWYSEEEMLRLIKQKAFL